MAERYFVNMTEKTTPEDTNLLVIEDAADTKKITFANLFKPIEDLLGPIAVEDYEEGTWTPTIIGGTVSGGPSYSNQLGKYIKKGNEVTAIFRVGFTAKGASIEGTISIGGFPFAAADSFANTHISLYNNVSYGTTYDGIGGQMANPTSLRLFRIGTGAVATLNATHLTDTSEFYGQITYFI